MNSLHSLKRPNNRPFLYFKETTSTMEEAKRAIDNGYREDLLVCADYQSRGRGRIPDRRWESGHGENLLFSWVISPKMIHGTLPLPLQVGYALFSFLNHRFDQSLSVDSDFNCLIKWPNDIYLNGKKVSGVMCETYKSYYIIGIGINCNQINFPDEICDKASSLVLELGVKEKINRAEILLAFIDLLSQTFKEGVDPQAIESSLMGFEEEVRYIEGDPYRNPVQYGILKGINCDGSLRLSKGQSETSLYSGELIF